MKTLFERINNTVKNWWVSLLMGILYLIVGICLIIFPANSYFILSVLFSISLLVGGILEIFFAISNKDNISSWGWYLAGGIIDLLLGIFLVSSPLLTMQVIPFLVAFWLMFRGITTIGFSMDLQRYGTKGWGWYLFLGILAVICSFIIIWQPGLGAVYVIYMLSLTFVLLGIFRIVFAFELKNLYRKNKEVFR